eukprot:1190509-Prorocentrum_minimum.AAC.3
MLPRTTVSRVRASGPPASLMESFKKASMRPSLSNGSTYTLPRPRKVQLYLIIEERERGRPPFSSQQ